MKVTTNVLRCILFCSCLSLAACGGGSESPSEPPADTGGTGTGGAGGDTGGDTGSDTNTVQTAAKFSDSSILRRPISVTNPMYLLHRSEQQDIDALPADLKPYTVALVSLSYRDQRPISEKYTSMREAFHRLADNNMWGILQVSSGFSNGLAEDDADITLFEKLYQEFPNLIGFQFVEQGWGFGGSRPFDKRVELYSDLLELSDKYGGYIHINDFQSISNSGQNTIVKFRNDRFREAS